jgi:hypothetical protein
MREVLCGSRSAGFCVDYDVTRGSSGKRPLPETAARSPPPCPLLSHQPILRPSPSAPLSGTISGVVLGCLSLVHRTSRASRLRAQWGFRGPWAKNFEAIADPKTAFSPRLVGRDSGARSFSALTPAAATRHERPSVGDRRPKLGPRRRTEELNRGPSFGLWSLVSVLWLASPLSNRRPCRCAEQPVPDPLGSALLPEVTRVSPPLWRVSTRQRERALPVAVGLDRS